MEFQIRDCATVDIPKVLAIEKLSFDDPYPQSLFKTFLQRFPEGFRVSETRGNVVGYCIILPLKKDKRTMILASLAVHPDFKRKKLGTKLLEDAVSIATRNQSIRISLQVAVNNLAGLELYSKFGFIRVGTIKNYYGRGQNAIQMEYALD